MLWRLQQGTVPKKHHIALRGEGDKLRYEECLTRAGFDGPYSILYHLERPHTQTLSKPDLGWTRPEAAAERPLAKRHYRSQDLQRRPGSFATARTPLLFNEDVVLSV